MGIYWKKKIPIEQHLTSWLSSTEDLEEVKLDTGKSLSKFKIFSVIREHLALSRKK